MSSSALASASTLDRSWAGRIARWRHLTLILWVSVSLPALRSLYYLFGGTSAITPNGQYRLWAGLIPEASGLLVLWYVLTSQGKTWRDIGWSPSWADIPRAFGLFLASTAAAWVAYISAQYLYHAYSGVFLTPKSVNLMLPWVGISALSIAYVCINPFFEELIVRAYTISELANLGTNRVVAIAISVVVQLSYHLYQGLARVIGLAMVFTVYSIYYHRTRRILPVVLVHLWSDLSWLFKAHL